MDVGDFGSEPGDDHRLESRLDLTDLTAHAASGIHEEEHVGAADPGDVGECHVVGHTERQLDANVGHHGGNAIFVRDPVAVVVETVATDFALFSEDGAFARSPLAAASGERDAGAHSFGADADAGDARAWRDPFGIFEARFHLVGRAVASLVDLAVAVVVQPVTELDLGEHRAFTVSPGGDAVGHDTGLAPGDADADTFCPIGSHIAGSGFAGWALAPLVHGAVTVVVEPVADLFRGRDPADAFAPEAELELPVTDLVAEGTYAETRVQGLAAVAGLLGVLMTATTLIHVTIAVVIEAVPTLVARGFRRRLARLGGVVLRRVLGSIFGGFPRRCDARLALGAIGDAHSVFAGLALRAVGVPIALRRIRRREAPALAPDK